MDVYNPENIHISLLATDVFALLTICLIFFFRMSSCTTFLAHHLWKINGELSMSLWRNKIYLMPLPHPVQVSSQQNIMSCALSWSNYTLLSLVHGKGCGFVRMWRSSPDLCLTTGWRRALSKWGNWMIRLPKQCKFLAVLKSGSLRVTRFASCYTNVAFNL